MTTGLIYTGAIGENAVRFYVPPIEAPDLPWVEIVDLLHLIQSPVGLARTFNWLFDRHKADLRSVGAPDGPKIILAPNWLAHETLKRVAHAGWCERQVCREFHQEASAAFEVLIAHIPAVQRIPYARRAQERLQERIAG